MEEEEPPAQPRRHRDRQTGGRSEGRWGNREMGRPDGVQPCVHCREGAKEKEGEEWWGEGG